MRRLSTFQSIAREPSHCTHYLNAMFGETMFERIVVDERRPRYGVAIDSESRFLLDCRPYAGQLRDDLSILVSQPEFKHFNAAWSNRSMFDLIRFPTMISIRPLLQPGGLKIRNL